MVVYVDCCCVYLLIVRLNWCCLPSKLIGYVSAWYVFITVSSVDFSLFNLAPDILSIHCIYCTQAMMQMQQSMQHLQGQGILPPGMGGMGGAGGASPFGGPFGAPMGAGFNPYAGMLGNGAGFGYPQPAAGGLNFNSLFAPQGGLAGAGSGNCLCVFLWVQVLLMRMQTLQSFLGWSCVFSALCVGHFVLINIFLRCTYRYAFVFNPMQQD